MPVDARPRGESWTGPFLRVLVILAGPVRGRVLVRLPDPFDAVDLLDVLGDDSGNEGFPVAAFHHSLADDAPREPRAVHEGRRQYLAAVLPEHAHVEIRGRSDPVSGRQ